MLNAIIITVSILIGATLIWAIRTLAKGIDSGRLIMILLLVDTIQDLVKFLIETITNAD